VVCDGQLVADHERVWARHQTLTDPAHRDAATRLRQQRSIRPRPGTATEVEPRWRAGYDAACGLRSS